MKPTDEQIKELWEWCGARCLKCRHLITKEIKPDRCCCHSYELDLDLNNLFRWTVPKVTQIGYELILFMTRDLCEIEINDVELPPAKQSQLEQDKDPVLALFWATYKIIKGGQL